MGFFVFQLIIFREQSKQHLDSSENGCRLPNVLKKPLYHIDLFSFLDHLLNYLLAVLNGLGV